MRQNEVKCLLMGGQACVLYGAAEFSRDTDLAVLADSENLGRLRQALELLEADVVAIPPFESRYLDMGLAVHFRCQRSDVQGMRIDVMSLMRGVDEFSVLWGRRTTFELESEQIELMSLPDLVKAKKTQRDKDWPMVTRLIEANYFTNRDEPTGQQIDFWLKELRTPSLLIEVASRFSTECRALLVERPLLEFAVARNEDGLRKELTTEEQQEREADMRYWKPLVETLSNLRMNRDRPGDRSR